MVQYNLTPYLKTRDIFRVMTDDNSDAFMKARQLKKSFDRPRQMEYLRLAGTKEFKRASRRLYFLLS